MQFIPLSVLSDFLDTRIQILPSEKQGEWALRVRAKYDAGKSLKIGSEALPLETVLAYLKKLSHPGILVFDQWIMQTKQLRNLLLHQQPGSNDFHTFIARDHKLLPHFSNFVTPMLFPALRNQQEVPTAKDMAAVFSYLYLLDLDARMPLQLRANAWLDEKLATLQQEIAKVSTEKELTVLILPFLSADFILFVNGFEKNFYAARMKYTQAMLEILQSPACSARLGGWIVKQLKGIDINAVHRSRIEDLQYEIRRGKRKFKNQEGRIRDGISPRLLLLITGIVVLLLGVGYFTWYAPWSEPEELRDFSGDKTSFEQFSVRERREIDSLINVLEKEKQLSPEENPVYGELAPADIALRQRAVFQNEKAEQFYADCQKDRSLMALGFIDTCAAYAQKQLGGKIFPDFGDLRTKAGKRRIFLQNDSEYQVIVLFFSDSQGAGVASAVLAADQKIRFRANAGETVLLLPGRDFGAFHANTKVKSSLPSANYMAHFCFQDGEFVRMLGQAYHFQPVDQGESRLILRGSVGSDFEVVGEAFQLK